MAGKPEAKRVKRAPGRRPRLPRYVLRLYVAGTTPRSVRTIVELKGLCETYLKGRYALEVIDIYQRPVLARDEQIIATPTLVRKLPVPLRRFVGRLEELRKVLVGMDLRKFESDEQTKDVRGARGPDITEAA